MSDCAIAARQGRARPEARGPGPENRGQGFSGDAMTTQLFTTWAGAQGRACGEEDPATPCIPARGCHVSPPDKETRSKFDWEACVTSAIISHGVWPATSVLDKKPPRHTATYATTYKNVLRGLDDTSQRGRFTRSANSDPRLPRRSSQLSCHSETFQQKGGKSEQKRESPSYFKTC